MIFRIRSPKGIFGQNMSDLRNGSLTGVSRSYQSAILKRPHHYKKLTTGFYKDIKMWKMFIDQWNGKGLFISPLWENYDTLSLFTDASGLLGYGGFFQNRWF